jgi:hypothetical protein
MQRRKKKFDILFNTLVVGFTGTRDGMTPNQKVTLRRLLTAFKEDNPHLEFRHGDCVGADAEAHVIAMGVGASIVIHPPLIDRYRAYCTKAKRVFKPKEYLSRNRDIVDASPILVAAPKQEKEPSADRAGGTWYTIRYARKKGSKLYILKP